MKGSIFILERFMIYIRYIYIEYGIENLLAVSYTVFFYLAI